MDGPPVLQGDAAAAVAHRGSHIQIIAAAGSGKTEVVAQRVGSLLADGVAPNGIVAFTFTERAARELKARIEARVAQRLGAAALDLLNGLFVGTIHAFCFRFLQERVPRYETYDVLDEHRLTGFLSRGAKRLGVRQLDPKGQNRLFASIEAFMGALDVVENELLDPASLPEPLRTVITDYYLSLEHYRLLTYGQQVARAVKELRRPEVAGAVHGDLRHLIVDEYQDVNPAQEELIRLLAGPQTELCVVGDDDQAIYQWRGSDVSNIVTFTDRYPGVATFQITTNRRSRPLIIDAANRFSPSIAGRLPKQMEHHRPPSATGSEVVAWTAPAEVAEAGYVTRIVDDLHDAGLAYRDIAVLVRGRVSYPRILEELATFGIPVQPGGRTGLFDQPEARLFSQTLCWLVDIDWRIGYTQSAPVTEADLLGGYSKVFDLDGRRRTSLRTHLREWKKAVPKESRPADLVGELYSLLDELRVRDWDLTDPLQVNRLGTFARITALLADYEAVRRRARHEDTGDGGAQTGGWDRGHWYYFNLATHVLNYAAGAYEGFDGEADVTVDAVDLTTVHHAKGLEWPAVFVPSLTKNRFPSMRAGQVQDRIVPRDRYPAARYEGSDTDERRLFYVAMTRSRDFLSVSRHARTDKRGASASPYYREVIADGIEIDPDSIVLPEVEPRSSGDEPLELTYSEMASYLSCAFAYRLRTLIGFQPRLATELGYGKAVHHVLRTVADDTRATGRVPTPDQINSLIEASFFLPTANKTAHQQLKDSARRLVLEYAANHADDLERVWMTERPFELHLDGVTVSGRADVILDREEGVADRLAILDYKTSTADLAEHALQLQVYADAGRREGLDVRAAYVHDLKAGQRAGVAVDDTSVATAEKVMTEAAVRLRSRDYKPTPGPVCTRCEVRAVCKAALRR